MTKPAEPRRLTPTERLHEVTMATLNRRPSEPESSVTIGVTAKRLHTWEITVRGPDAAACCAEAETLDGVLAAKYAHEIVPDSNGSDGDKEARTAAAIARSRAKSRGATA